MTRAELLTEWLRFFHDAIRFGADNIRAGQIADVLTFMPSAGAKDCDGSVQ